jgi:polyphosphate glucokinase
VNVLVVDIGGSHIKAGLAETDARVQFDSSPELGPQQLFARVRRETNGWRYDAAAIGYPGRVGAKGPIDEPGNLGSGWVGFDFAQALGTPVRIVNDAVLQALGAYRGGRMLFLGLGTGVGSALVTEHVAVPLELGELPYQDGTLMNSLGRQGLERLGQRRWQQIVLDVTPALKRAFMAEDVVFGGGNAVQIETLPPDTRCGNNDDAIEGGRRLWRELVEPHDRESSPFWRVVR